MKFKVGDKVRHDGGDWWLYGRVSAIFEHDISPCYRLNIERMEKKSCKFSVTQFEFELEPWYEELESGKDGRKWESLEVEYLKKYYGVLNNEDLSKFLQRSPFAIEEKWLQLQSEPKVEAKTKVEPKAEPAKKVEVKKTEPVVAKVAPKKAVAPTPKKVEVPVPKKSKKQGVKQKRKGSKPRRTASEAWHRNWEDYKNGNRSNVIAAWASLNRKEYNTGKLLEEKLEKLIEINFPFETNYKKKAVTGITA